MHARQILTLAASAMALALAACSEAPQGEPPTDVEAVDAVAVDEGATDSATAAATTEYCDLTGQDEPVGECARFGRQYADLDAGRDAFSPQESMKEGETRTVSYAVTRLPKSVQGEDGEIAESVLPPPPPPPPPPPMPGEGPGYYSPNPAATYYGSKDGTPESSPPTGAPSPDASEPAPTPAPTGPTQEQIDAAIADTDEQNAAALGDAASEVETGQIKVARFMYACLRGTPLLKVEPEGCQSRDTREDPQVVWNWQVTATAPGTHHLNLRSGVEVRTAKGEPRRIGQRAVNRTITVAVTKIGGFERAMKQAERWLNSPVKAIGALTGLLLAVVALIAAIRKLRGGKGGDAG